VNHLDAPDTGAPYTAEDFRLDVNAGRTVDNLRYAAENAETPQAREYYRQRLIEYLSND
jgi:hypothetical protein